MTENSDKLGCYSNISQTTDDPAPKAAIEQASNMLKMHCQLRTERISSNWYKNNNKYWTYLQNILLSQCKENEDCIRAANSKDEYFSIESLFMILMLQQQKTINEVSDKYQNEKKKLREDNGMDGS